MRPTAAATTRPLAVPSTPSTLAFVGELLVRDGATAQADGAPYANSRQVPRIRIVGVVTESPELRASTWRADKQCVECGAALLQADAGGVVRADGHDRMACRNTCFGPAVFRYQPERALRLVGGRFGVVGA